MSITRLAPSKTNGHAAAKEPQCAVPPARTAPAITFVIEENRVYTLAALRELLGVGKYALQREIRRKRLTAHRRLGRWWLVGSDVLRWLQEG
jgi:hypothetical protein